MPRILKLPKNLVRGIADARPSASGDHMNFPIAPSGTTTAYADARQSYPMGSDGAPLGESGYDKASGTFRLRKY